jgi:hypothetical protein
MRADLDELRRLVRILLLVSVGIFTLLLVSCWFHVGINDGVNAVEYGAARLLWWRGIVYTPSWFDAGVCPFEWALVPAIDHDVGWSSYKIIVPLWPVLGVSLFATWRVSKREQLARRGACRSCGYDRRGLADDAKCPECGAVPIGAPK